MNGIVWVNGKPVPLELLALVLENEKNEAETKPPPKLKL